VVFLRPISLVVAFVLSSLASAADLEFDGVVDDVRQKLLIGKPSALQFMNGTVVRSAEVVNFIKDPRSDAIRFFQYKDGKRKPKIKTTDVEATVLDDEFESLAKLVVIHLIETDPNAFSQFFEDLKLGHSGTDALMMNYGATPEAFAADFGNKMGVPNLTP
jgi:hypothetical protein